MTTRRNAQMTITQAESTANSQKTTYIYFQNAQNAQECKKSGHTSNQY